MFGVGMILSGSENDQPNGSYGPREAKMTGTCDLLHQNYTHVVKKKIGQF
jgi:hypothetical protein